MSQSELIDVGAGEDKSPNKPENELRLVNEGKDLNIEY